MVNMDYRYYKKEGGRVRIALIAGERIEGFAIATTRRDEHSSNSKRPQGMHPSSVSAPVASVADFNLAVTIPDASCPSIVACHKNPSSSKI